MILKRKIVVNQYGENVEVTLTKRRYGYTIEVGGVHYANEYNHLFAVQKYNNI